jgi:hypothetical protein
MLHDESFGVMMLISFMSCAWAKDPNANAPMAAPKAVLAKNFETSLILLLRMVLFDVQTGGQKSSGNRMAKRAFAPLHGVRCFYAASQPNPADRSTPMSNALADYRNHAKNTRRA